MRLFLILLAATATAIPASAAEPNKRGFSPQEFFLGQTEGLGTVTKILSSPTQVTVHGHGRREGKTLILDQTVMQPGSPPERRQWRLVEAFPGRFRGTLSDAEGQVTGVVTGNDFHVRYRTKGAVDVDQHLVLQPGGHVIINQMVFHKFGLRVARMTETIRKVD